MHVSLRSRIVLISSAAVIGALAVSGLITYQIVRSSTLDAIDASLSSIADSNAMTIRQWIDAKELAVESTAAVIDHGDPQHYVAQMAHGGGFGVATAGWSDKAFVSTDAVPAGYDPTRRPWYVSAIAKGGVAVTKPYPDSGTGVPYVAFVAPVIRAGQPVGVVSGAVTLDAIRDVVNAVHPTPSSLAFVVSQDGQVIAHPDSALSLKPVGSVAEQLTPDVLARLASKPGSNEVEMGGAMKRLKVEPVRGTGWYLVIALDEREATAGLREMLKAMLLAIVALTIGAALCAALATSRSFRRLGQVRDAMEIIASGDGDLTQRLSVNGSDEVAQIATSFNGFVTRIDSLLCQVRAGAETMQVATAEIDAGNRDLSRRTERSAGSLQETAAALTQIAESVRHSVDSTAEASQLATSTCEIARKGGTAMTDIVGMMDGIARASGSISDITGMIDSIAFQTNILALNAAVEAARAGEEGRGFSVVAAEVRTLAQRSAAAAAEIKRLVDASSQSVRAGVAGVHSAGETIQSIVREIARVSALMIEIEGSMNEQSVGISQIDRSVAEMDHATQQNAALVEQSAAASASLNDQARNLAGLVGLFRLSAMTDDALQT